MARSKLLIVVRKLDVGGMERMVIELVESIDRDKYEPVVCTIEDAGQLAGRLSESDTRLVSLNKGPGLSFKCVMDLRKLLKRERVDLIHTHNETANFYASIANRLTSNRRAIVHTKHGRGTPENKKSLFRNRLTSMLTDVIVPVSDDVKELCHRLEWVPERKLRTIINGVGLEPYIRAAESRVDKPEFVFGNIGRLSAVKNQDLLIRAFGQLVKTMPFCRLLIVGDGPLMGELSALVAELKLERLVELAGYRADIPEQLFRIDCFVLSSISEGTPLVVIEAMATKCPIISTNVGGLRDMIVDGETGYLVNSQDEDALFDCMKSFANDKGECRRMGENAQRVAVDKYSVKDMAQQYSELYRHILEDRKP